MKKEANSGKKRKCRFHISEKTVLNLSIAIISIFLLSLFIFIVFGNWTFSWLLNEEKIGQFGSFIGGVIGTMVGATSALLLYITLQEQIKLYKRQKLDLKIERFENKFYQMLQIHRDNVDQISINNNVSGRKAFSRLFNELRFIYYYCINNIEEQKKSDTEIKLSDEKIYNIAYLIFFFGVGQTSSKLVADILGSENSKIFNKLTTCIHKTQDFYRRDIKRLTLKAKVSEGESIQFYYDYIPFQGHMGNLSHYVRHIFQLVKFVEEHYPLSNDTKVKNNYITTIRSQLSTYEQAFLYYNALSVLGKPWLDSEQSEGKLLRKYPIIKSLPKPLADFYKTPDEIFGPSEKNEDDNILFEWTEIKKRYKNLDNKEIVT